MKSTRGYPDAGIIKFGAELQKLRNETAAVVA